MGELCGSGAKCRKFVGTRLGWRERDGSRLRTMTQLYVKADLCTGRIRGLRELRGSKLERRVADGSKLLFDVLILNMLKALLR